MAEERPKRYLVDLFLPRVETVRDVGVILDCKLNFQLHYDTIEVWDVGGKPEVRRFWQHYTAGALGLVYVVDSTDRARMSEAAEELEAVLAWEELRSAVVLVLANKQDLPNALGPAEVAEELRLTANATHRWFVQPTDATSGNGLRAGLDWMSDVLLKYHLTKECCPYKLPCICL